MIRRIPLLAAALVVAAILAPGPASRAAGPEPVSIVIHDFLVSEDTAVGTFEASGAVETSGGESQVVRVDGFTLHCVHTLTNAEGTIVIHSQCNMVTSEGQWRVVSGTGAYTGLQGNGSLAMVFTDDPAEAFEILEGRVF